MAAGVGNAVPRLPAWAWVLAATIFGIAALQVLIPTDPAYLAQREVFVGNVVYRGVVTGTNLGVAAKFVIAVVGLPMMYAFAYRHEARSLYWSAMAYVGGTAISALVGLSDLELGTSISQSLTHVPVGAGRAPGLTAHPNYVAMTCVFSLPLVLWEIVSPRLRVRLAAMAGLVVLAGGIYVSGSRSGGAVSAVVALMSIVLIQRLRRVLPTALLIMAGIAAVAFVVKPELGSDVLKTLRLKGSSGSVSGSDAARAVVNGQGLRDFLHSPIDGSGLQVAGEAHNVYLQAMAAGGLLLLVAYLAFLGFGLLQAWRAAPTHPLASPLFVSIIGGAAFNWAQNALTERIVYVPIALVAALPLAASIPQSTDAGEPPDHVRGDDSGYALGRIQPDEFSRHLRMNRHV
jgi:O-antigen ligase